MEKETILRFRATPPSCRPLFGIDKDKPTPDPLPLCSSDRARGGRQKTPTTKCSPRLSSIVTSVPTRPLTNAESSDGYKGKEEVWERRSQSDMFPSARRSSPLTAQTPSSRESHFSRQVDRLAYISSSSSGPKSSMLSHSFVTLNTASTSVRAGNLAAPVQLLQLQRSISSASFSDSLQASHGANVSFTSNAINGVPMLRPRGFPHPSSSPSCPSTSPYRSSFSVDASLPGSPSTSATSPPNPRGERKDKDLRFHDCRDQLFSEQRIRLPLHFASSPSFTTSQPRKNSPPPSAGSSPSSECLSSSPVSCPFSPFPSIPSARGMAASHERTSVERSSEETRLKKIEETGYNKQEAAGIGAAPSEQEHMGRRAGAAEAEREAPEPLGRRGQAIAETISRIRALREIGKERKKREGVQVVQVGEAGETVGTALRSMFKNKGKDRCDVWKRRQQETIAGLHGASAQRQTQRAAEDGGYACDYAKETIAVVLRFQPSKEPRLDTRQKGGKLSREQRSRETGIKTDPHFRTSEQVTRNGERRIIEGNATEETCEGNRKGDTGEFEQSGEGSRCGEKKEERETTLSRGFALPVEKKERGKQVTYRGSEGTEPPRQRMAAAEFGSDGPTVMVPDESFSLRSGTQLPLESAASAAHDRVQTDPFSPMSIKSVHSSSTECYPPSLHHPVSPCSTRSFHSSFTTSSPSAFPLSPAGALTSVCHRAPTSLRCSQSSDAKGGEESHAHADMKVLSTKALSAAASPRVSHSSSVSSPAIPVALDFSFSFTASWSHSGKPQKETEPASKVETVSATPTQFVSVEGTRDSTVSSHALCSSRELPSKSRHEKLRPSPETPSNRAAMLDEEIRRTSFASSSSSSRSSSRIRVSSLSSYEADRGERMCADNLPPSIVSPPTAFSQRCDPPLGSTASCSSAFSSSPCSAVHAGEDEGQFEWKNMSLDSASVCVSCSPHHPSGFSCPSPLDRKPSANSETKRQEAASQYSPTCTFQAKPFIGEMQKTNGSDEEGGVLVEQGILTPQQAMATCRRGNAEIFHPGKENDSVCRQTEAERAASPQTPSQSRSSSCSKQEGINTPCDICLSPRCPLVEERETVVMHEEGKESRVISSLPDRGAPSCTTSSSASSLSFPSSSSWPSSLSASSSAAGIASSSASVSEVDASSCSRLESSSSSASGVDLTSFFPSLPSLASASSHSSDLSPCSSSPSSLSSQEATDGLEGDSDASERVEWTRKVGDEFDRRNELQEKKMGRGRASFPCAAFPFLDQCSVKAAEALSFLFVFPASAYDVIPERITEFRGRTSHQAPPPSSSLSPGSPASCSSFSRHTEAAQSCSSLSSDMRSRYPEGGDRDSRVEGQRLDDGDLYDGTRRDRGNRRPLSEREETQAKQNADREEKVFPKDDREARKQTGEDGEWEDSCATLRSPSPSGPTPSHPCRSSLYSPSSASAPPSPVSNSQAHSPTCSSLSPSLSSPLSICGSSGRRRYPSLPSESLQSSLPPPAPASPATREPPTKRGDKDDSDRRRMNEELSEKEGKKEAEPEGEAATEGNKEAMESARGVWRETDILTELSGWKEGMLLQEPGEKENEQKKASKTNAQVGDGAIEKGLEEEINREGANAAEEAREKSRQSDEEQLSSKGNSTSGSLEPSSGSSVIPLLASSELRVTDNDTKDGLDSSSSPIFEPSAPQLHTSCFKKRKRKASGKLIGQKKPQVQARVLLLRPRKRRSEKRDRGDSGVEVAAIEQDDARRESETETPESVKSGTASERVVEERKRVDEARELTSQTSAREGIEAAKAKTQQREKERKGSETESEESEKKKQRMTESAAGNTGDEDHETRGLQTKGDPEKENEEAEGDRLAAPWNRSQLEGETGGQEWQEKGSAKGESDKEEGQGKRYGKAKGGEQMKNAELKAEGKRVGTNPGDERGGEQGSDRDASQEGEASDSGKDLDSRGNAEVLETTRVPTDEELTVCLFPKDDAGAEGENLAACAFEATPQEIDPPSTSFPLCSSSSGEDQRQRLLPSPFRLRRSEEEQTLPYLSLSSALGREAEGKRQSLPVSASSPSQNLPECGNLTNVMSRFSGSLENDDCCRPVSCPSPSKCVPSEIEANGGKPEGACDSPRDTEKLAGENPKSETSLAVSQFSHAELVAFVHGLLEKAIESPQVVCKVKKVLLQEIEEREKRKVANTEKGQTGDRRQHKEEAKEEREAEEKYEEAGGGEGNEKQGESDQELEDGEKKKDGSEEAQKAEQAKAEKSERVTTQEHKEKKQNTGGNKEEETMLNDGEKGQGRTAEREKEGNKDKEGNAGRKSTTRPVTKRRGERAEESRDVDPQSETQASGKVEEGRELRPRRRVNMHRLEELHREAFEKQRRNRERAEAIARDEALRLEQEKALLKRRLAPPRPKKQEGKTVARPSSNGSSGQGRIPEGAPASIAARREGESVEPQEEREDHHLDGPPLPVQSVTRLLDTKRAPETSPESEAEDREVRRVPGGTRDSSLRKRGEVRGNGERQRAPLVSPSLAACPVAQTQDRRIPADEKAEKLSVEHTAVVLQGSLQPQWDNVERFLDTVDERAALLGSQIAEHASKPLSSVQCGPSDVTASTLGCSSRADEPKTVRLLRLLEERAFAAAVDVLRGLRSSGDALGDSGECMRFEGTSWEELDLLSATCTAKGRNSTSWSTRGATAQKATRREVEARQKRGEEREGMGIQEGRLRGDKGGRLCGSKDGRRSVPKEGGTTGEEREVEKEGLGRSKTESSSCTSQFRGTGGLAASAAGKSQVLKQKLSISASPVVASSVQVLGCSHHSRIRSHSSPQKNKDTLEGIQGRNVDGGKKENPGSEKREANHSCPRPRQPQGRLRVTNHEEKAAKPCKSSAASSSQSSLPAWKPAGVAAVKPPPQEPLPKLRSSSCSSSPCLSLSGRPVASVCSQQVTREASRRDSAVPRRPRSPFSPLRFSFLSPETETQGSLHAQEREGLTGAKRGSRILDCNVISTPTHLRRRSSSSLRYACTSHAFSESEIPVWRPAGVASRSPTPFGGGKIFCRVENAKKTRSSSRLKARPTSLVHARESPRNEKDRASSRSRFSSLFSSFSASKSRASLVRAASLHRGPSAEGRRREEMTTDNEAKIYPEKTYLPYGSGRRVGAANALAEARFPNEVEVPHLHAERPRQVLSSVASVHAFLPYAEERTGPCARSYRAVPTTETQLVAEQESVFPSRKETQCIEAKDRKSEKRVDERDCFLGRNCSDQQNRNSLSASSEWLPQQRRPTLSSLPSSTSAACSPGVSLSCLAARNEHGKKHNGKPKCFCLPSLPATSPLGPPLAPGDSLEEKADHFLQWVYADQLQRQKKGRYLSPTARVAEGRTERGTESYREDEEARIVMEPERAEKGSVYSREGSGTGNQRSSSLHGKENESFESGREAGRAAFALTRRPGFPFDSASIERFSFERVESIMGKITEMEELTGLRKREGI